MTTLQEATYYVALIFFSVMTIAVLAFSVMALVIKHKVTKAKHSIEEKIDIITHLPYIGKHILQAVKIHLK